LTRTPELDPPACFLGLALNELLGEQNTLVQIENSDKFRARHALDLIVARTLVNTVAFVLTQVVCLVLCKL
jgi:hypothetical protein